MERINMATAKKAAAKKSPAKKSSPKPAATWAERFATISGLSIPNGATFFIRWTDFDASGADDGLAVDDFVTVRGRLVRRPLDPSARLKPLWHDYLEPLWSGSCVMFGLVSLNSGSARISIPSPVSGRIRSTTESSPLRL